MKGGSPASSVKALRLVFPSSLFICKCVMFFTYQTNLIILLLLVFLSVEILKTWSISEILNSPLSYRMIGIYWFKNDSFCVSFQCMLEKVGNWNFDIFLFDRLTNGELTSGISFVFYLLAKLLHLCCSVVCDCSLKSTSSGSIFYDF